MKLWDSRFDCEDEEEDEDEQEPLTLLATFDNPDGRWTHVRKRSS